MADIWVPENNILRECASPFGRMISTGNTRLTGRYQRLSALSLCLVLRGKSSIRRSFRQVSAAHRMDSTYRSGVYGVVYTFAVHTGGFASRISLFGRRSRFTACCVVLPCAYLMIGDPGGRRGGPIPPVHETTRVLRTHVFFYATQGLSLVRLVLRGSA